MMGLRSIYFSLVKQPLKWLVRIKTLPEQPVTTLDINTDQPVYYVLRTRATSSFLMLQQQCKNLGLPEPRYISKSDQTIPNGGVFFIQHKQIFGRRPSTIKKYNRQLQNLLQQHDDNMDAPQLIPVSIYWGRNPGKEKSLLRVLFTDTESATPIRKLLILLFQGRNSFMHFGQPVKLSLLSTASSAESKALKIIRTLRALLAVIFFFFCSRFIASITPSLASKLVNICFRLATNGPMAAVHCRWK